MKTDTIILDEIVQRIVDAVHPIRILLFGSAAREEMRRDSDLDILVVMPDQADPWKTYDTLCMKLMGLPIPVDLVVSTEQDLESYGENWSLVYYPALQEGKEIYAA